ncbi:MAG: L-serine ammonia-lyase [Thermodesulfobacteriota bacterium]
MPPITTSVFELFSIGPGPSSSHTMGPMRAGLDFLARCRELTLKERRRAERFEARLFGSLAATGRGHGTDRALLAGLLGHAPESCPPGLLSSLDPKAGHELALSPRNGGPCLTIRPEDLVFDALDHRHPHSNTLILRLLDRAGKPVYQRTYYSIGGGSIAFKRQREQARPEPPFPFASMAELRERMHRRRKRLPELMAENEMALSGLDRAGLEAGLDRVLDAMLASVDRGLSASGKLPGPLGVYRKAGTLYRNSLSREHRDRFLLALNAFALAAAEENAAGRTIVTAPTAGSCGVVAGCLYLLKALFRLPRDTQRRALLAGAAIGLLARHNASVSGAEVGCQGEIGVASAMAAAMLAQAAGLGVRICENAAEIALEHHLGLTCDPVAGYVQIPCIERNAMGAVKAYNAYLIAAAEIPARHKVDFDAALAAMAATGMHMDKRYKETAQGGLAVSMQGIC